MVSQRMRFWFSAIFEKNEKYSNLPSHDFKIFFFRILKEVKILKLDNQLFSFHRGHGWVLNSDLNSESRVESESGRIWETFSETWGWWWRWFWRRFWWILNLEKFGIWSKKSTCSWIWSCLKTSKSNPTRHAVSKLPPTFGNRDDQRTHFLQNFQSCFWIRSCSWISKQPKNQKATFEKKQDGRSQNLQGDLHGTLQ